MPPLPVSIPVAAVSGSFSLVRVPPRLASVEELTRFHTLEYVGKIQSLSRAQGGEAGDFATFGPGSYEIACLAVGGVLNAIDAVVTGRTDTGDKVRNAYCLARPPGHHAEKDRGMGFCLFNNVALGAMHARVKQGLKRVAIVDYDVHHGNGTQVERGAARYAPFPPSLPPFLPPSLFSSLCPLSHVPTYGKAPG